MRVASCTGAGDLGVPFLLLTWWDKRGRVWL